MKFARYLEDTQIPEWKKAYIDYRGLKKRITAIRRAQAATRPHRPRTSSVGSATLVSKAPTGSIEDHTDATALDATSARSQSATAPELDSDTIWADNEDTDSAAAQRTKCSPSHTLGPAKPKQHPDSLPLRRRNTSFDLLARAASQRVYHSPPPSAGLETPNDWNLSHPVPLKELLPRLIPVQRAFFEALDTQLDKVETFYCEREKELRERTAQLKIQLQELKDHRRLFHEAHPLTSSQPAWIAIPLTRFRRRIPKFLPHTTSRDPLPSPEHTRDAAVYARTSVFHTGVGVSDHANDGLTSGVTTEKDLTLQEKAKDTDNNTVPLSKSSGSESSPETRVGNETNDSQQRSRTHVHMLSPAAKRKSLDAKRKSADARAHDPEEYQNAKKTLKKAVLECYRGLEILNNYRTLNIIGFRKALKKFEKVTHIPAQQAYFQEKIEPSAFASGAAVEGMMREMEELFAACFVRGDRKKAMNRLRGIQRKSHHFSSFKSGMFVGLAVPAFVDGLYQSFQHETREALPGWNGLLFIYGIFLIPTLFSFLIGLDILVWANARINYVFIFELDIRTRMDPREYFEIPSLLLSTLCYAFWLSFKRIGSQAVSPYTWPLIWLACIAGALINPFPILHRPSRWWLIKNLGRLLTPGPRRVEFADFWMGDQFCSLVFTLSNLWVVGCSYSRGLENWQTCASGKYWGYEFILASLPFLIRVIQSIKRWVDSRLGTHLINGGKYASGILMYLFYYLWREHNGSRGPNFVVWCVFATIYSTYAASWDLLMDWSLLRPHSKYPLLRSDLLYAGYFPFYYFAIATNILIRFIWVLYIPQTGPNYFLRTFIAGFLEFLRRWQWNLIRLENEHLGNMDQYRVTREVPLPYTREEIVHESDGDDETDERASLSWHQRKSQVSKKSMTEQP